MITDHSPERTSKSRYPTGISYQKPIQAAKEAVRTIDLADRLAGAGKMRRVGEKWVTNCPLPGHEDRSPSFTVYLETNSWFCFGCLKGGDVVELYCLAHGYERREAHVAAAMLLMEYGHEVPQRPPAWFRKQERQKKARDAISEAVMRRHQRRIFAIIWHEIGPGVEKEDRQTEIETAWEEARRITRLLLAGRRTS